jgi:sialic acid synthase
MRNCTVIAEIGCNHMGNIEIARKMIETLHSFCGITHVKFQKRHNRTLLTEEQYTQPHPVPENSYGSTYGEHREYLEFSTEQHRQLKEWCDERQMVYSTSVWDIPSLQEIAKLEPLYIKIPSAVNTNLELIDVACSEFGGQIHVSLGMTTRVEEDALISAFNRRGRLKDVVLYACTSGYPIQPSEAYLLEIIRLRSAYGSSVADVGYSGHHNGISLDNAAFTLGANFIERHFTMDRTWKGTDHAASLEPDGIRRLARNLEFIALALTERPSEISPVEEPQRKKLKWLR